MELLNVANYIAIFLLTALAIYLIGFGIGRRSAYRDLDRNLPVHTKRPINNPRWKPSPNTVLESGTRK